MSAPDDKDKDKTQNLMQRVRMMPLSEAMRLARSSDQQERVILERLHGKLAWEALLRNPGLSSPEVARIASAKVIKLVIGLAILHQPMAKPPHWSP